jgi:hypothetical protein
MEIRKMQGTILKGALVKGIILTDLSQDAE